MNSVRPAALRTASNSAIDPSPKTKNSSENPVESLQIPEIGLKTPQVSDSLQTVSDSLFAIYLFVYCIYCICLFIYLFAKIVHWVMIHVPFVSSWFCAQLHGSQVELQKNNVHTFLLSVHLGQSRAPDK